MRLCCALTIPAGNEVESEAVFSAVDSVPYSVIDSVPYSVIE